MTDLTFDAWNQAETRRIVDESDSVTASHVRKARSGGFARFTLWDDYLAHCDTEGLTPESGPFN